jgi:hypothetical protein
MVCTVLGFSRRETHYIERFAMKFRHLENEVRAQTVAPSWGPAHKQRRAAMSSRSLPPGIVGTDAELLNAALDRLEALPFVKEAKAEPRPHLGRVRCEMWCRATHTASAMKQPAVMLNRKPPEDAASVPNYLVAAEKLLTIIAREHAGCLVAAEAAKAKAQQHGMRSPLERYTQLARTAIALLLRSFCMRVELASNTVPAQGLSLTALAPPFVLRRQWLRAHAYMLHADPRDCRHVPRRQRD